MTALASEPLVTPHGGRLVDRTGHRPEGVERLERVVLSEREVADLDMLASGALSPLEGFMGTRDYERVLAEMRLDSGLPWALPVCLSSERVPRGERVALADRLGRVLAVLDVEEVFEYDKGREAQLCFGTVEPAHPGVSRLLRQPRWYLGGTVTVFARPPALFPDLALDPHQTRRLFRDHGWQTVVGFQTRNPIHRGHEYLTKGALETVDGLLLHPLVGETKADDVPVATRVECYRLLTERYYPAERVVLATFPAAMRYAGPREAVWHAICRKNYGCSHFIVGRDHAGVRAYYEPYEAQRVFGTFGREELGIEPIMFDRAFWCRGCGQMATLKTCPHGDEDHILLSGTRVRELLAHGERPPVEFARPEVADMLIAAWRRRRAA